MGQRGEGGRERKGGRNAREREGASKRVGDKNGRDIERGIMGAGGRWQEVGVTTVVLGSYGVV